MSYKYEEEFREIVEEVKINDNIAEQSFIHGWSPKINNFIEFLASKEYLRDKQIKNISIQDIREYFDSIINYSWNTIKLTHHCLKKIFNYLYKNKNYPDVFKDFDVNEYKTEENSKPKAFIISQIDISKLYSFIFDANNKVEDRLLLSLVLQNGLSTGEIKNLKRSNIDFEDKNLYVTTNNKKYDKTIMAEDVVFLLRLYIKENKIDYHDNLIKKSTEKLNKLIKQITDKKINISDVRDIFRYSIIKKYKKELYLISKILNEDMASTTKIVKKYEIFKDEDIEEEERALLNEFNENMR